MWIYYIIGDFYSIYKWSIYISTLKYQFVVRCCVWICVKFGVNWLYLGLIAGLLTDYTNENRHVLLLYLFFFQKLTTAGIIIHVIHSVFATVSSMITRALANLGTCKYPAQGNGAQVGSTLFAHVTLVSHLTFGYVYSLKYSGVICRNHCRASCLIVRTW